MTSLTFGKPQVCKFIVNTPRWDGSLWTKFNNDNQRSGDRPGTAVVQEWKKHCHRCLDIRTTTKTWSRWTLWNLQKSFGVGRTSTSFWSSSHFVGASHKFFVQESDHELDRSSSSIQTPKSKLSFRAQKLGDGNWNLESIMEFKWFWKSVLGICELYFYSSSNLNSSKPQ